LMIWGLFVRTLMNLLDLDGKDNKLRELKKEANKLIQSLFYIIGIR